MECPSTVLFTSVHDALLNMFYANRIGVDEYAREFFIKVEEDMEKLELCGHDWAAVLHHRLNAFFHENNRSLNDRTTGHDGLEMVLRRILREPFLSDALFSHDTNNHLVQEDPSVILVYRGNHGSIETHGDASETYVFESLGDWLREKRGDFLVGYPEEPNVTLPEIYPTVQQWFDETGFTDQFILGVQDEDWLEQIIEETLSLKPDISQN